MARLQPKVFVVESNQRNLDWIRNRRQQFDAVQTPHRRRGNGLLDRSQGIRRDG